MFTPRPYQQEAVNKLITNNGGLAVLPTATGKSLCIALLCQHHQQKGEKVNLLYLFLV